jgi:hypothetical protein
MKQQLERWLLELRQMERRWQPLLVRLHLVQPHLERPLMEQPQLERLHLVLPLLE